MDQEPSHPPLRPPLSNSSSPRAGEPQDLDKLLKWQQERLERKLRGEYESYVQHLSELVYDSLGTPLRVFSVRVQGAHNTRESFLASLVDPFIHPYKYSPFSQTPHDLESILHAVRGITNRLQDTDIFKTIQVKLERSRDPLATEEDVDVVFDTREKGRFFLKTATEVGNGEGNASIMGHVRNVFGGAETFEAHLSLGTTTRRSFNAIFALPLTNDLKTRGELSIFGMERDNTSYASSTEGLRGLRAVVRNGSVEQGMHAVAYEAVLRHIGNLKPTASLSIREAAGQTLKSALSYTWTRDTRDDKITGTRGIYTKLYQELAGLSGDAHFYKSEAEMQLSRPVSPSTTMSFAARAGLLLPMGARGSLFPDRFQLGGPTDVRLFRTNGLGPRDGSDSLGGDMYWGAGISLISDIPRKPQWPIKSHMFINAGRLDALDKSRSLLGNVTSCLGKPSMSAGVGLIYRFDPVRVEVNFGVPLVASKSDRSRRGVQVGMGLEFL